MATSVTVQQSHDAKVDIDVLRAQVSGNNKDKITEDTMSELIKLSESPDYGEEFLDTYRDHLNILSSNPKYSSNAYMSAVKFFYLVETGNNLTNAYITVFPERYKRRVDKGGAKKDITGEASRYNNTALLQEIRKVACMPVQLVHRHILHEAILVQAELMRDAKSEIVRQKAGEVLIRELKPAEDSVLNINVEDGTSSIIKDLQKAAEDLARNQHESVVAGVPLKVITVASLQEASQEPDIIEGECNQDGTKPSNSTSTDWSF